MSFSFLPAPHRVRHAAATAAFALLACLAPQARAVVLSSVTRVAVGGTHSCALTAAGGVLCWGANDQGQLGDGSNLPSVEPVPVVGLEQGVVAISVGNLHSCAVLGSGALRCWGYNVSGQIGRPGPASNVPLAVAGLESGVSAVSAGSLHTCAVQQGAAKCFGDGNGGVLGSSAALPMFNPPLPVEGLAADVVDVVASRFHSCAVTGDGKAWCWGINWAAELGDGTTTTRFTPVQVQGLGGAAIAIRAGQFHSCALLADGAVKCWGDNGVGQLGDGTNQQRKVATLVAGLTAAAVDLSAGGSSTCAVTAGGNLSCWGANASGQLGDGSRVARSTPAELPALAGRAVAVSVAASHVCALTAAGALQCWGWNRDGQLGDGTRSASPRALPVKGEGLHAVSGGYLHACALGSGGTLHCWGDNYSGQLGDGSRATRRAPVQVVAGAGHLAVSAGGFHTCALDAQRAAHCWGDNSRGQLGDGSSSAPRPLPGPVSLGAGLKALASGRFHSCAIAADDSLWCWGRNEEGQLGIGTASSSSALPVQVAALGTSVAALSAGAYHTCALTHSGAAKCWGWGDFGVLGDGTSGTNRPSPVDVVGLAGGVTQIDAGHQKTCALHGGAVSCWGLVSIDEGDSTTVATHATPQPIGGLNEVVQIGAGAYHACARFGDGALSCWGDNLYGQLGDGLRADREAPAAVVDLPAAVVGLSVGDVHSCAESTDGTLRCWGDDQFGQLGRGGRDYALPAAVQAPASVFGSGFE